MTFGLVLQACGPMQATTNPFAGVGTNANGVQTSTSGNATQLMQQCQPQANVVNNPNSPSASASFRVCSATKLGGAPTSLAVFPEDRANKQVCVFPARMTFGGWGGLPIAQNTFAAPAQRYASQCVTVSGTGSALSFSGIDHNAVFIVPYAQAATFANCAATGNIDYCASQSGVQYSYGTIY